MSPFIIILIILAIGAVVFYCLAGGKEAAGSPARLGSASGAGRVRTGQRSRACTRTSRAQDLPEGAFADRAKNIITGRIRRPAGDPAGLPLRHRPRQEPLDPQPGRGHPAVRFSHRSPCSSAGRTPSTRWGSSSGPTTSISSRPSSAASSTSSRTDRKWAYDVIHTRTMEYLLQAPSFTIEFGFGEIAVYKTGLLRSRAATNRP